MGKHPVNNKCKFYSSYNHVSINNCAKYSSSKCKMDKCLGKNMRYCNSATFNYCQETSGYTMLPILSFIVSRGKRKGKIAIY